MKSEPSISMEAETARNKLCWDLHRETAQALSGDKWHWFSYHFRILPPHPFAQSLINACADCEEHLPGLGRQLLHELCAISGRDKHEPHYDQLMQKLAEILVLRQILRLPWPKGTSFQHEPAATPGGKRPELLITTPEQIFVFEVKAPALLDHERKRAANGTQVPGRALPMEAMRKIAGNDGLTLPRDNPIKDFLVSADEKFAPFKAQSQCSTTLVIVWDDHIYEPITSLVHEQCGLLTPNSFFRDKNGSAHKFPSVDSVIVVRHMLYFKRAAGEQPLLERAHAFDFGDERALPNVHIPVPGGDCLPAYILDGLRALPLEHPFMQMAAEYRPQDFIWWHNA